MYTRDAAVAAFHDFIHLQSFPCVAAKSALATKGMRIVVAGDLRNGHDDTRIIPALRSAPAAQEATKGLVSTVILFPQTPPLSEFSFERYLWARLQALFEADRVHFKWDPRVSSDPQSAQFAMSFGATAYFVVGLHPGASRLARRAPMAALAFNPHAQFQRIKDNGTYERLRTIVRERDIVLQGDANPMLADHGEVSEAAQYSGRKVSARWACPFRPLPGARI